MLFVLALLQSYISHVSSLKRCEVPVLPDHVVPSQGIKTSYAEGSKFYYQCEDGYKFRNNGEVVTRYKVICINGIWDPQPINRCVDDCSNRCGAHGVCTKTIGRDGYCQCQPNYYGKYCDQRVCELLPFMINPTNGRYSKTSGDEEDGKYALNSVLTFQCNTGYQTTDMKYFKCTISGWSSAKAPVCTKKNCQLPSHMDQNLKSVPDMSLIPVFLQGITLTFTCGDHRELIGSRSIQCEPNGEWSGAWPTCKSLKCPQPPTYLHAYYTSKDYYVNERVQYICHPNYAMLNDGYLTCNTNLQWVGQQPTCSRVSDFMKFCAKDGKVMMKTSPGHYVCLYDRTHRATTTVRTYYANGNSSKASTKPLTIVTSIAGGLLLLLLMVISLVACQRRRMARLHRRNGRRRMNVEDERYSFVYYSNDVHVVLPSYDEAIQNHRRHQPPPYITADDRDSVAPPTSGTNEMNTGATNTEINNDYETIDDILPGQQNTTSEQSLTSSDEPIYASIQRITDPTQNNTNNLEDCASMITLNSQAETASAHSHEDNFSASTSPVVSFADEALEDNDSISSAELCENFEDNDSYEDIPLISQK